MVLIVTGCGSLTGPNQEYIAPVVKGRVVDATTLQPLAGVRVTRTSGTKNVEDPFPKKAGTTLIQPVPAVTDAEGQFTLPAEKEAEQEDKSK